MHRGYIKLWRKITEWEWWDNSLVVWFFLKLLFMANWEDKKWQGMIIKRGQFVASYEELRFYQGYGKRKKRLGLTPTRLLVKRLKSTGELTVVRIGHIMLYTIVNYELYQDKPLEKTDKLTVTSTLKRHFDDTLATTTKELKEYNNIKKVSQKDTAPLTNAVFVQTLKEIYPHIDIDKELKKMDGWLLAHKGRQKTRKFVVNWLNKIDQPLKPNDPYEDLPKL